MSRLILGIDVGTTTVKTVLVEEERSRTVHCESVAHGASIEHECATYAEQNVALILSAVDRCLDNLRNAVDLTRVVAVGLCGQMHGVVPWKSSNPTDCSRLITWQDRRAEGLIAHVPTGYGTASLLWLHQNEPELLSRFDRAGTIQDYVFGIMCLNPNDQSVMTSHNAASWGGFSSSQNDWDKRSLPHAFPSHLLPRIVDPTQKFLLIKDFCGLPQGIAIYPALGDLQTAVYASHQPGTALLNFSTSAQICVVAKKSDIPADLPPSIDQFAYFDDEVLLVAASLNGGNVIEAFVQSIQSWCASLTSVELSNAELWNKVEEILLKPESEIDIESSKISPLVFGERHGVLPEFVFTNPPSTVSLPSMLGGLVNGLLKNVCCSMFPVTTLRRLGVHSVQLSGRAASVPWLTERLRHFYGRYGLKTEVHGASDDSAYGAALHALHCVRK